jgi:hypothetical protein
VPLLEFVAVAVSVDVAPAACGAEAATSSALQLIATIEPNTHTQWET